MKKILFCLAVCIGVSSYADATKTNAVSNGAASGKVYRNPFLKKTGGMVLRPGVRQGVIAIINEQKTINSTNFNRIAKTFERALRIKMPISNAAKRLSSLRDIDGAFASSQADFAVIVVDHPDCDVALSVLPEKKYSIVNIAPLKTDARSEAFLISRTRKQIARGLLYVIGGACSASLLNVMGPIYSNAELDKIADDAIPVDVLARTFNYLKASGCETHAYVPYRTAVMQGWAPAPTNEYQKAIWEKVHALPTAPIKINPETRKVTK